MPYVLIPDDEPLWWKEVQSDSSEDLDVNDPEDATEFSDPCLQRTLTGDLSGSPDCLYINVWTPSLNSSARLDVMVFIHGGGLMTGSGNEAGA
jgi:para-nitrobenzyl esterase